MKKEGSAISTQSGVASHGTGRLTGRPAPGAAEAASLARLRLVDGHNDLPIALRFRRESRVDEVGSGLPELHTDIPRLRAGKVGAQFWSVFVPTGTAEALAVQMVLEQIDLVYRMIDHHPGALRLCRSAAEAEQARADGVIASLLGMEGGHSIGGSLAVLRIMAALGVRYLTLTHNEGPDWAQACGEDPGSHGLTDFGRSVVAEMNRLGVLVDLSHTATATMHAALDVSAAPVIFSHSSCRAVCDHPRNVDDAVLTRLARNGGLLMVTFVPEFVSRSYADWREAEQQHAATLGLASPLQQHEAQFAGSPAWQDLCRWHDSHPAPDVTIAQVVAHLDHAREVAGVAHLGLGGDYDGVPALPAALRDVSTYPALFAALADDGWSAGDLEALAWGNALRVLRDAEELAARSATTFLTSPSMPTGVTGRKRLAKPPSASTAGWMQRAISSSSSSAAASPSATLFSCLTRSSAPAGAAACASRSCRGSSCPCARSRSAPTSVLRPSSGTSPRGLT
jgi:membrane dipeptidase